MLKTLDRTLLELHEQLTSAENLSPEQLAMLRDAVSEIQDRLNEKNASPSGLAERWRDATQQLELSHPTLTNTIGRVADLLSQIGI